MIEEVNDLKTSLDLLSGEITAVRLQQESILDLVGEVKVRRLEDEEKDKKIMFLESRVSDLEQSTRMNDFIITGLKIKPWVFVRAVTTRSYAQASTPDSNWQQSEYTESVEEQVAAFLWSKGIDVECNTIKACHPLPRKNKTQTNYEVLKPLKTKLHF